MKFPKLFKLRYSKTRYHTSRKTGKYIPSFILAKKICRATKAERYREL